MKGTWQGSGTWQTSGGGPGLVALVVVLVVIAAVLHFIWHTIVEAAEIAAIVVVGFIAAAALAGAAYAALRIRARMLGQRARQPITVRSVVVQPGAGPASWPRRLGRSPRRCAWPMTSSSSWPRSSDAVSGRGDLRAELSPKGPRRRHLFP